MATKEQLRKMRKKFKLGEYSKHKSIKKRGIHTMARRKRSKFRSYAKKTNALGNVTQLLAAAAYGATRNKIYSATNSVSSRLGSYGHELLIGGGALVAGSLIKNKLVRDITRPIVLIEAASAGAQATSSLMGTTGSTSSSGVVFY